MESYLEPLPERVGHGVFKEVNMNEGKERDAHDELSPSKSDRHGTEPVSVPENADFRYDEQEAPDAVNEDVTRSEKSEE